MCISLVTRILLSSLCILVISIGTFLNVSLASILIRSREQRNRTSTIYILSLLMSQIFACLYEAPYYFLSLTLNLPPPPQEQYRLPCRISIFISYFISAVKIFNLTVMSLDRYVAIVFPFTYERCITKRKVITSVLLTWIIPWAFLMPLLIKEEWTGYEGGCGYACGLRYRYTDAVYIILAGIVVITVPLLVMLTTNIKVFLTARRQQLEIHSERCRLKVRSIDATAMHYKQSKSFQCTNQEKMDSNEGIAQLGNAARRKGSGILYLFEKRFVKKNRSKSDSDDAGIALQHKYGSINRTEIGVTECNEGGAEMHQSNERDAEEIITYVEESIMKWRKTKKTRFIKSMSENDLGFMKGAKNVPKRRNSKSACFSGQKIELKEISSRIDTNGHDMLKVKSGMNEAVLARDEEPGAGKNSSGTFHNSKHPTQQQLRTGMFRSLKKKRMSMKSLNSEEESNSQVSWSVISSTLLLVLAFFITYVPFLVTRLLMTNSFLVFSDEIVTYTALLTTIGNVLNPVIILGTRRKLKADFRKVFCNR